MRESFSSWAYPINKARVSLSRWGVWGVECVTWKGPDEGLQPAREIAHVKLDISGKTLKLILKDCTVMS